MVLAEDATQNSPQQHLFFYCYTAALLTPQLSHYLHLFRLQQIIILSYLMSMSLSDLKKKRCKSVAKNMCK